jgi:hypothetical protein
LHAFYVHVHVLIGGEKGREYIADCEEERRGVETRWLGRPKVVKGTSHSTTLTSPFDIGIDTFTSPMPSKQPRMACIISLAVVELISNRRGGGGVSAVPQRGDPVE